MWLRQLGYGTVVLGLLQSWSWGAQQYRIEPGWSTVEFAVKNFGVNTVEGQFREFEGTVNYDPSDVTKSSVDVSINTASVDTGIKKRDEHLRTVDFFDVRAFPVMTFRSERIDKKPQGYVMAGRLTIKGISKTVELPFEFSLKEAAAGVPTLRAEAHGDLDRHDFGINYGNNFSVSKVVRVRVHIQAIPGYAHDQTPR